MRQRAILSSLFLMCVLAGLAALPLSAQDVVITVNDPQFQWVDSDCIDLDGGGRGRDPWFWGVPQACDPPDGATNAGCDFLFSFNRSDDNNMFPELGACTGTLQQPHQCPSDPKPPEWQYLGEGRDHCIPANWATWYPKGSKALPLPGWYEVLVEVPAPRDRFGEPDFGDGISTDARYQIYADGEAYRVSVSHQNPTTEHSLGVFFFNADETEFVYLDDVNSDSTESPPFERAIAYADVIFRESQAPEPDQQKIEEDFSLGGPVGTEGHPEQWKDPVGDPVMSTTGNFILDEVDLRIPGLGMNELLVRRFYNARGAHVGHFGRSWSSMGDVRLVTYLGGSATVWFADGQGRYFENDGGTFTGADGVFDLLEQTASGWRLTTPGQWVYEFEPYGLNDSLGRIVRRSDRYGNTVHFSWSNDRLVSMADDSGRSVTFTHAGDRIASMRDPIGRTWSYSYADDLLLSVTGPRADTVTYTYGGSSCLESITDPEGIVFLQNVYEVVDDKCRVVEQYDAAGSLATFSYAPGETVFTDHLGNTTTYRFDEAFRRTEKVDALGQAELSVWNDEYQMVESVDRRGNSWSYTYDDQDNMTQSVCPTNCITNASFTAENDPSQITNAEGNTTSFAWTQGNLVGMTQADGSALSLTYDQFGQLATRTDANGHTTTFTYDGAGNLVEVRDPLGNTTSATYDLVGRRVSATDANLRTTEFTFDPADNLIAVVDPKDQATTFEFDLNDRLVRMTDRRDGVRTFEYDDLLRLTAQVDPEGHRVEHSYDLMNNRASTTDARGTTTQFRYDQLYRLIEAEDALGQVTRFEYDPNGNMVRRTDAINGVTEFTYEPRNLVETVTDALDGVARFEYDLLGRLTAEVNPRTARTEYAYDVLDRLTLVRDALSGETERSYDLVGNLVERTDANGHTMVVGYDAADRVVSILDPEAHERTFAYDGVGNLTRSVNPRGAETLLHYDANDNLIMLRDALAGVTRFAYDEEDNRIEVVDQNGNSTHFDYNLDTLLVGLREAGGQESVFGYDSAHNQVEFTNAKGHATVRSFDVLNRLTEQADPLGHMTRYAYDARNRLVGLTDAESNSTLYSYDFLNRLVGVTDALGQVTEYGYDPVGNLIEMLDANQNQTTFSFDLLDRMVEEVNPVGSTWRYGYDAVGNTIEKRNARGQVINYVYDRDDLLRQEGFPDKADVSYDYDHAHNLTQMVDGLGTTANAFDLLDRLTDSTNHVGQQVAYTYDPVGNRTSFRHQDGSLLRYEYDQNNRQQRIVDPTGNVFDTTYDLTHNIVGIAYPNDTDTSLSYDAADRLLSVFNRQNDGDIISRFDYSLDRVGNRVRTDETYRWPHPRNITTNYQYDPTYRLTRSSDSLGRYNDYQFDAVGNRLALGSNYDPYRTPTDVSPYSVASSYDNANRLVGSAHSVFGTTNYFYDADGNRVRREGPHVWTGADDTLRTDSEYDSENRVTRIANQRQVNRRRWQTLDETTMAYDGFDRLFRRSYDKKQGGGGKKWSDFVYDGLDPVSEHVEPSPQYTNYHRGLGRMLSLREKRGGGKGNLYYYHHDGMGSVSALTKHSGQSVHAYRYSDYGTPLDNNGRAADSSNFTNPHNSFTYIGQEWVEETGMFHFHSREYDSVAGVWTRADDFRGVPGQPSSTHRYQYVGNNPVNYLDLYGFERGSAPSQPASSALPSMEPGSVVRGAGDQCSAVEAVENFYQVSAEGQAGNYPPSLLQCSDPTILHRFERSIVPKTQCYLPAAPTTCENIVAKRNEIKLLPRRNYGHYWIVIGDESYGWYPAEDPGILRLFLGVKGDLNGQQMYDGTPTQDHHHDDPAALEFNPMTFGSCHVAEECLREFANSYSGDWSYPRSSCQTFQKEALAQCGLLVP